MHIQTRGITGKVVRFLSKRREIIWLIEYSCALGILQALAHIPMLLGVVNIGAGKAFAASPIIVAVSLLSMVITFNLDNMTRSHRANTKSSCFISLSTSTLLIVLGSLCVYGTNLCLPAQTASYQTITLVLSCAGSAIMGAGVTLSMIHLTHHLTLPSSRDIGFIFCSACPIGSCLTILLSALESSAAACILIAAMGLGAALLVHNAAKNAPATIPQEPQSVSDILGTPRNIDRWRATIALAVSVFTGAMLILCATKSSGFSDNVLISYQDNHLLYFSLSIIIASIIYILFYKLSKVISLTFAFRIALPVIGVASLACAFGSHAIAVVVLCSFALTFLDWATLLFGLLMSRADMSYDGRRAFRAHSGQMVGIAMAMIASTFALQRLDASHLCLILITLVMATFVICVPIQEARYTGLSFDKQKQLGALDGLDRQRYSEAVVQFDLTAREAEVLALLMTDLDNAGIARRLNVSRPTINTHVQHIYAKCNVHSRQELATKIGLNYSGKGRDFEKGRP